MVTCDYCFEILHTRGVEMTNAEAAAITRHVVDCAPCRARLKAWEEEFAQKPAAYQAEIDAIANDKVKKIFTDPEGL